MYVYIYIYICICVYIYIYIYACMRLIETCESHQQETEQCCLRDVADPRMRTSILAKSLM